jgi:hypothetical protein
MTGDEVITLTLTGQQHEALEGLVRRQAVEHKGLLLCSAAPFFCFDSGEVRLRLQATFLEWSAANRILKIIREQ